MTVRASQRMSAFLRREIDRRARAHLGSPLSHRRFPDVDFACWAHAHGDPLLALHLRLKLLDPA